MEDLCVDIISRKGALLINTPSAHFLVDLKEHGDSGRLDRDTTLLLVVSSIREAHVTGLVGGDNAGL